MGKNNYVFVIIISMFILILPRLTLADVTVHDAANDFFMKKCNPEEIAVECSRKESIFISFNIFTDNKCLPYEHDPSYRLLANYYGSNGGIERYCYKWIPPISILF